MNFCEMIVTAIITFGATFGGVFLAIKADNDREKKSHFDYKTRLSKALFREVNSLYWGFIDMPKLEQGQDYFIEMRVLRDTVGDQIKYFDNSELVEELSRLRSVLNVVEFKLGAFSRANEGIKLNQNAYWYSISKDIIELWENWLVEGTAKTFIVCDLIRKEMPEVNFAEESKKGIERKHKPATKK